VRRLVLISLLVGGLVATAVALAGPPRLERKRLTAADTALAKRVAMRASDLPRAWTRQPTPARPQQLPRCPGADLDFSGFTITGTAASSFRRGTSTVESFVEVFKSRRDAAGDYRKSTQPKLLACLGPELRRQAARSGLDVRLVSARFAGQRAVGDRAFEYRIVTSIATGTGSSVRVHVDVIGFQRGRTLVGTYFSGTSPVPGRLTVVRSIAARAR
jgi:hypothetical protein